MRWTPILLLAACHHASPAPASPPENTAEQPGVAGYVLVTQGAWLRSAPKRDAVGARSEELSGNATDEPNLESVWAARVIADRGDWIEVENLVGDDAGAHCYGTIAGLYAMRLRFHVQATDLMSVTRRAISMRYDNGSGVELSAGVAVAPMGDRFRIGVDYTHPVVTLDREAIGRSYPSPTERLDAHLDDANLTFVPPGPFLVDDTEVSLPDYELQSALVEEAQDPDHQLVTVRMSCSAYRGLVEKTDQGIGYGPGGYGYGTIGSGASDLPVIPADTKLFWLDGTPAGETIEDFTVRWGLDEDGCFRVPLRDTVDLGWTGDEEWFLRLCTKG